MECTHCCFARKGAVRQDGREMTLAECLSFGPNTSLLGTVCLLGACAMSCASQHTVPCEARHEHSIEPARVNVDAPRCGMPEALRQREWPLRLVGTNAQELEPPAPGTASIVLLPDTQYYAACRYPHLQRQSEWIAAQRGPRNIIAALSLGDLTDHNTPAEWEFVRSSLAPITNGFPLLLTTGNHDVGDEGTTNHRESLLHAYFDENWATTNHALRAVMTPGRIDNAFYTFELGSFRLGVLMLEWSPRRVTVQWADQVLSQFRDSRVVIATHAYLYDDATRYDFATRGGEQQWNPLDYRTAQGTGVADGNHDGEMLWNALVRKHPNVFLVVSGHVLRQGAAHLTSVGDAGNSVDQVLVNYQMLDEGGLGYLRFFEFLPDGRTLHMKTFSPSLGLFSYSSDQDFRIQVTPPLWAGATG